MKKLKIPAFREWSLKKTIILCVLCICMLLIPVYLFSEEPRVQALSCEGNYYYSTAQIYKIAGLDGPMRIWQDPPFKIAAALNRDHLIEEAQVSLDGQKLSIKIKEKMIIGYYVQDGLNYLLARDGESIPIEDPSLMKSLIHFPLMADLSDEQMKMICKEFQEYPDYLTREVQEKIAEILPWAESYDPNMIKMVMQDGNIVFSSINSLHMIANYQKMLTELQGEDVCLVLDGQNQAIDKIACDYMYMSSEERDQYRQNLKSQVDKAKKEAEEAVRASSSEAESETAHQEQATSQADGQESKEETQPSEAQPEQAEETAQPEEEQQPEQSETSKVEADDWEDSQYDWLVYSPSQNVYRDKWGTDQYRFDEATMSFVKLN